MPIDKAKSFQLHFRLIIQIIKVSLFENIFLLKK